MRPAPMEIEFYGVVEYIPWTVLLPIEVRYHSCPNINYLT